MTKTEARQFIGQPVQMLWRDPQGFAGWTTTPLNLESALNQTVCWVVGLNARGELVTAATLGSAEWSDLNAMPLACVVSMARIKLPKA